MEVANIGPVSAQEFFGHGAHGVGLGNAYSVVFNYKALNESIVACKAFVMELLRRYRLTGMGYLLCAEADMEPNGWPAILRDMLANSGWSPKLRYYFPECRHDGKRYGYESNWITFEIEEDHLQELVGVDGFVPWTGASRVSLLLVPEQEIGIFISNTPYALGATGSLLEECLVAMEISHDFDGVRVFVSERHPLAGQPV